MSEEGCVSEANKKVAENSHVYDLGSEWRGFNARYAVR